MGPEVENMSQKKQTSSKEIEKQWVIAVETFIKKINETN